MTLPGRVRLEWKDRVAGAGLVGVGYLLGMAPLWIGIVIIYFGTPDASPALRVVLLSLPYLLLAIPAFITVLALRIAKAPFGSVSLAAVPGACAVFIVVACIARSPGSDESLPRFLWPSLSIFETLSLAFKRADGASWLLLLGAAFTGALAGSYFVRPSWLRPSRLFQ